MNDKPCPLCNGTGKKVEQPANPTGAAQPFNVAYVPNPAAAACVPANFSIYPVNLAQ